jgi:hypothetical protein
VIAPIPTKEGFVSLNGKPPPTLRTYAGLLADFGQAQDFTLRGVWEALRYVPTFALADGSQLRPLTAQALLRRTVAEGTEHFALVPLEAVAEEPLAGFTPERAWRTIRRDQP